MFFKVRTQKKEALLLHRLTFQDTTNACNEIVEAIANESTVCPEKTRKFMQRISTEIIL